MSFHVSTTFLFICIINHLHRADTSSKSKFKTCKISTTKFQDTNIPPTNARIMKEVISLHVGQFGIQSGNALWELYCLEHEVLPNGEVVNPTVDQPGFGVFFQEEVKDKCSPRAVYTDLDPTVIDEVRTGKFRHLHRPERLISGKEDAANNYARGRYTIGQENLEKTAEAIRLQAEVCDQMTGFISYHSLGGGTGSGFNSLIDNLLNEEYGKKGLIEVALFPSQQLSTSVVEPYNTILSTHAVMNKTNCVILVDNEAMNNICTKRLGLNQPNFNNLNRLLAQAISTTTCSLRFDSHLHTDFMDFHTNLVPYPRFHFPVFSLAPVNSPELLNGDSIKLIEMTANCFDQQYRMAVCDNEQGLYMACCLMFRGDIPPKDVHEAIANIKRTKTKFVKWSPTGFKIGVTSELPMSIQGSEIGCENRLVCMLCNNTAIQNVWQNLLNKYHTMSKKGAFHHWYLAEGMEQAEFDQAGEDITALVNEYSDITSDNYH